MQDHTWISRVDSIYVHTNKYSANKFYEEYNMELLVMSQKLCVCEILNQSYTVCRERSSGEY
jgi:hypothetical protein